MPTAPCLHVRSGASQKLNSTPLLYNGDTAPESGGVNGAISEAASL